MAQPVPEAGDFGQCGELALVGGLPRQRVGEAAAAQFRRRFGVQDGQHAAPKPELEQGTVTVGVDDEPAVVSMEVNRPRYAGHRIRDESSYRPV